MISFLSPFFLLGLAALAAPVLVHLVRRTRARRVEFPALVFVRQIPQRTIRRRTLHNRLLLLLRCLAMMLIVFAFTRPFFSGSRATAETERTPASLILLDSSLSMREGDHFAEAKRRAEALLDTAQTGERFALLGFGKRYEIITRFTTDQGRVRASLKGLSAGLEGTDYEQALRGAESLFAELKTTGPKRIILISDFQAAGWNRAGNSFKLRSDVRLIPVDVSGGEERANVAVTNVEARAVVYGQKYADKLAVHLSNFGDEARSPLQLDLKINDQTVERRDVSLGARDSLVVEFSGFNLAEGANRCVVSLDANDFAHDNQFYFTLRRELPAQGLIVERAVRGRNESFYLQSALTTGDTLPFSFTTKSAGAVDPGGLSSHALVILNDTGALPGALSEGLTRYVEAGGHLIVAAGPHADAESFNQSLERIAPAVLREAVQLERGESIALTDAKMDHPIFEAFKSGGRLMGARVFGYQRAEPLGRAAVLARFENGSPALIEKETGTSGGRVLLFLTSLDTGWTDLPLTPVYLPLVQQMVRYLGQREDADAWHPLGQTFRVEKASDATAPPAIDTPSGARLMEQSLTPDGDALVTGREPGFYRLRYGTGPQFAAVNVDGSEGDFAKLNLEEFLQSVTDGGGLAEAASAGDRPSDEEIEARQRIWWPLLLFALLLLTAEALIARRTKMVKMIG